jgi:hypothetical protein
VTEADDTDRISNELADLPHVDLEPLVARQQWVRAQKRLAGTSQPRSNLEPAILVALATAQLLWAVFRVLELSAVHLS